MYRIAFILYLLIGSFFNLTAQEVLVSPDINIRNNFSYDIVGQVNERIVLFRDAGDEYHMETFDNEMSMTFATTILFENNKVDIYNILGIDTAFQILYGYSKDDSIRVMSRRYNEKAELLDSLCLFTVERKVFKRFRHEHSEDESKTVLYSQLKKEKFQYYLIDNKKNKLVYSNFFEFNEVDLIQDFSFLLVSNDGVGLAYFDSDNFRFSMDDHKGHLYMMYPNTQTHQYIPINYEGYLAIDLKMSLNNANNQLVLAGLYSKINNIAAEGYFLLNKKLNEFIPGETFTRTPFQRNFIAEVIGTKKKKVETLNDFVMKEVLLREDGGVVLMMESYKEYARRSTYRSYSRKDAALYGERGWIDYYNEDILIVSTFPSGEEHWKTILHKKQFSQDDDAIFSSFYIFQTPSRLRLIYNDEIAKNSTISEYLLDPIGHYERRSLLNTEYENLKMRFNDGLQLTSNSLVVPSQQSYILNLVKISY